ncbi:MAG: DUF1553 domain-containing protein, partial [Planctomycetota bacterium]
IHPRTGEPAVPRIPGEAFLTSSETPQDAFAGWLTSDDNPYFAKAIVNRLWKAMMGRGLVEPVDDLRLTNPATHPELLELLADEFVSQGFQFRPMLRMIALSEAYARGTHVDTPSNDEKYYSQTIRKPLEPEVLADAISDVLGVAEAYGSLPAGTRAVALIDPATESSSLDVLGRCSRDSSCESGSSTATGGDLSRKLHWFNGGLLNKRLQSENGRLSALIESGASNLEVVESFYAAALTRPPSQQERAYWKTQLGDVDGPNRRSLLEDFVWALLSTEEFTTNH